MASYSFILTVDESTPISSFYGNRKNPFDASSNTEEIHYGLDFACPISSNVYAAADGEVIWVGNNNTYGNTIIIEHPDGYLTLSAHLNEINVKAVDVGKTGDSIKN